MLDKQNGLDQVYNNSDSSILSYQKNNLIRNYIKAALYNAPTPFFKMNLTQYIFFLVLVSILTAGFTSMLTLYIFQKTAQNNYYFTPDYRVMGIAQRDLIDSEDKLTSIMRNYHIDKSNAPEIGALVALDEKGLYIISKEESQKSFEIYPLRNIPSHNYQYNGYLFIPNVQTRFKQYVLAEKIKNINVLESLKNNKNITISKRSLLQLGAYVWKQQDNQYSVFLEKDIIKEHLTDPSQN